MKKLFITVSVLFCGIYTHALNYIKAAVASPISRDDKPLILKYFDSKETLSEFDQRQHMSHSSRGSHMSHYSSRVCYFKWMNDSLSSNLTKMAIQQLTTQNHPYLVQVVCNTINELDKI